MARWGFVYDQARCIGCNACQMACKDLNNLEKGMFFRRVDTQEVTCEGTKMWMHYSGACNHCGKPACVKACPTGAMHVMEDHTVGHNRNRCIGCGGCTWACPYGAPKLSHRMGVAMKCDSCRSLRAKGENPACVDACLTHCLTFTDLDLIPAVEKEGMVSDLPMLPDASLTEPALLIRRRVPMQGCEICSDSTQSGSPPPIGGGVLQISLSGG